MSEFLHILPEIYLEKAISLKPFGLDEYGWSKDSFLRMIDDVYANDFVMMGADVYSLKKGRISSLHEYWHYEKDVDESMAEFLLHSKKGMKKFIDKFDPRRTDLIFVPMIIEKRFLETENSLENEWVCSFLEL